MTIRYLGLLSMALACIFMYMTRYEMTPDQDFLVWAGAWGFLIYGVLLMGKQMRMEAVEDAIKRNVSDDMVDDVQFDFYLNQKAWARKRFHWLTRVTLGLAVALGLFA